MKLASPERMQFLTGPSPGHRALPKLEIDHFRYGSAPIDHLLGAKNFDIDASILKKVPITTETTTFYNMLGGSERIAYTHDGRSGQLFAVDVGRLLVKMMSMKSWRNE